MSHVSIGHKSVLLSTFGHGKVKELKDDPLINIYFPV